MKKLITLILFMSIFVGCTPIPHQLDGQILYTKNGKEIMLCWQQGWGNSWGFKEKIRVESFEGEIVERWVWIEAESREKVFRND